MIYFYNKKLRLIYLILVFLSLNIFFSNCSGNSASEESSSNISNSDNQFKSCIAAKDSQLASPQTIDQLVQLINVLPKPVNLSCLITALKKPLNVFAVNNTFSAQPAVGINNPRIFIMNGNFIMSVVPAGIGMTLLEVSQIISQSASTKGEIQFPVADILPTDAPYTKILESKGETTGGTSCRTCHQGEIRNLNINTGTAYNNELIKPDPFKRVTQPYMKTQAQNCNSQLNAHRCDLLKAIYIDGQAQDADFPDGP